MRRVLKHRVRSVAIVTMKSGAAFRGVLFDHDDQLLTLRNVEMLARGEAPTPVDGELLLFIADVDTVQIV